MEQLLATKFYIPPTRQKLVSRPRLVERVNQSLHRKLTLISAPAGFGKTTLVSEWVEQACSNHQNECSIAWLSLDENDNDLVRFLTYLISALQRAEGVDQRFGSEALNMLQSPQPPPIESVLTSLINQLSNLPGKIVLVLDDYHLISQAAIDDALSFLLDHFPPQLHLIVSTRVDPQLPLARLRAKSQLNELRAVDLRFSSSEASDFLNKAMGLTLSEEDITALEIRTEGWIAGLQLAAISIRGSKDHSSLIDSFTGSHRLVLDYLIEEVLKQQTESVQNFLLKTAILDRMSGPLCNAITGHNSGQQILEHLEQANLFVVPLDKERRWYRYHHLFSDLLQKQLYQNPASSVGGVDEDVAKLHIRASKWYEDNGLEIEAFRHAAAANDIERATRLMEGEGMPLHFRGAASPVLNWLKSLPKDVLDANPSLWTTYATVLVFVGQYNSVEPKLQAAEAALERAKPDTKNRDIVGRIAAIRATLATFQYQVENILTHSHRALEYLDPDNLPFHTATTWKMGYAYQLQGDREAAKQSFIEAIAISQASENIFVNILAKIGLGQIQESDNQLHLAAKTYRGILKLAGDPPLPIACEAHLGLGRIHYAWNKLEAAQQHGRLSLQLSHQLENTDRRVDCEVLLAILKLAQGDVVEAEASLVSSEFFVQEHNFANQMPLVASAKVLILLHKGDLTAAADLAHAYELPISQARVHLAQGDTTAALAALELARQEAEAKKWQDQRLKAMVLQAVALHMRGETDPALQLLNETLAIMEPEGFIRIFIDEGPPMAKLLYEALDREISPKYVSRLLSAFSETEPKQTAEGKLQSQATVLIEPLSERELEVLQLMSIGLTNREIAAKLFLSKNTIKVHARNIFGKLGVNNRTQAVIKAKTLGVLAPD